MVKQSKTIRRGRPVQSKLEKIKLATAKAFIEWEKVEKEFFFTLGIEKGDNSERAQGVLQVAAIRLDISKDIDLKINEIALAKKQKKPKSIINSLVEERTALYQGRNEMPDLGYTTDEWLDMNAYSMKKRLGKPKLSLEQRYNRAKEDFETKLTKLRKLEKDEKVKETSVQDLVNNFQNKSRGGRLDGGPLAILDIELKRLDRKIFHITSGQEAKEQEIKMAKRKDPERGRPFEDLDEKLERFMADRKALLAQMDAIYQDLSEDQKIIRDLKIQRREINKIKAECVAQNLEVKDYEMRDLDHPLIEKLIDAEMKLDEIESIRLASKHDMTESTHTEPVVTETQANNVNNSFEEQLVSKKANEKLEPLKDMFSSVESLESDAKKIANR